MLKVSTSFLLYISLEPSIYKKVDETTAIATSLKVFKKNNNSTVRAIFIQLMYYYVNEIILHKQRNERARTTHFIHLP